MDSESELATGSRGSSPRISNGSMTTESDASESFAEQFDPYINSDAEASVVTEGTPISFYSLRDTGPPRMQLPLLGHALGPVTSSEDGSTDGSLQVDHSLLDAVEVSTPRSVASPVSPGHFPRVEADPRASQILHTLDNKF